MDNGKPQSTTVFEAHEGAIARPHVEPPAESPRVYTNAPATEAGGSLDVLLLDTLNTPIGDQVLVRQKMLRCLKTIPAGRPIAVFTLASRLRFVQGFTTDSAAIARAVTAQGSVEASALLDDPQSSSSSGDLGGLSASADIAGGLQQFEADITSFETDQRVAMTLDALKRIARYLSNVPGRKNLIWISGSFPLKIDPDPTLENPFNAMRNYIEDVREADPLLSAARVAVYPVDGRGLLTPPSSNPANSFSSQAPSARSGGSRRHGGGGGLPNSPLSAGPNKSPEQEADAKFQRQSAEEHFSMTQIAEETGGEANFNTNDLGGAVGRAMAHGDDYYTVGYVPKLKKDDNGYHRLKIIIPAENEASYRRGYFATDFSATRKDAEGASKSIREALELWSPPISDLIFHVRLIPASERVPADVTVSSGLAKGAAETRRYLVDFNISTDKLAISADADGNHHARLEFGVVAYNSRGRRLGYTDRSVDIRLMPALYERTVREGIPFQQAIELPIGRSFVRVMVVDLDGSRLGAMEIPLNVSKD